ncbi:NAD(P)-dependent oxidoreductase [Nocardioides yefusunii]|uniref:NAD(P)-dependent oxidoreductase n=1 Tax=Nocardioides yefusunii TaxID=2500546 RepID=A0ABW1QZ66_9ACTN|nr:NAD(P)-binding oxidoreductase [Nocardioides yefusunii]
MKIAVLGATGGVGTHLVQMALDEGHDVTVLARTPAKVERAADVTIVQGDALDAERVRDTVRGADVVISALGSTRGPEQDTSLRRMAGVLATALADDEAPQRVLWCASEGVNGEIPGVFGKFAMKMLAKPLADHAAAIETLQATGVGLTVARPRALNTKPLNLDYTEVFAGPAQGGYSIPRASVAHFLLKAAQDDAYVNTSVALAVAK